MFTVRTYFCGQLLIFYTPKDIHAINTPVLLISRRIQSFPPLQTKNLCSLNSSGQSNWFLGWWISFFLVCTCYVEKVLMLILDQKIFMIFQSVLTRLVHDSFKTRSWFDTDLHSFLAWLFLIQVILRKFKPAIEVSHFCFWGFQVSYLKAFFNLEKWTLFTKQLHAYRSDVKIFPKSPLSWLYFMNVLFKVDVLRLHDSRPLLLSILDPRTQQRCKNWRLSYPGLAQRDYIKLKRGACIDEFQHWTVNQQFLKPYLLRKTRKLSWSTTSSGTDHAMKWVTGTRFWRL